MEETEQPAHASRPSHPKNVPEPSSATKPPQPSTSGVKKPAKPTLSVSKIQTFEVPCARMETISSDTQTALHAEQDTQTPQPPKGVNVRTQTKRKRTRSVGCQPSLLPPIRFPTTTSSAQTDNIDKSDEINHRQEESEKEMKNNGTQTETKPPKKPSAQEPSTSSQTLTPQVETTEASAQTGPMEVGDRPTASILPPVPYDANEEDTEDEEDTPLFVPERVEFVPPPGSLDITVDKVK